MIKDISRMNLTFGDFIAERNHLKKSRKEKRVNEDKEPEVYTRKTKEIDDLDEFVNQIVGDQSKRRD